MAEVEREELAARRLPFNDRTKPIFCGFFEPQDDVGRESLNIGAERLQGSPVAELLCCVRSVEGASNWD